jgi:acetyl esterase/lipase
VLSVPSRQVDPDVQACCHVRPGTACGIRPGSWLEIRDPRRLSGSEAFMRSHVFAMLPASILLALFPSAAHAQDWSTYYTVRHAQEFKIDWAGFYAKATALTATTRKTVRHVLDVKYGDHAKQALDLYLPPGASGAPVLLFIHGGGFREGDRAQYGYIAAPFAARGIVTAVTSYRLTPEFTYPSQPDDIRRAIAWLWKNVRSHGGDPARLFVGGHSAGAILSADVGLRTGWMSAQGLPGDVIKGLVPVSGGYDLTSLPSVNNYVPDAARRAEASPINHVTGSSPWDPSSRISRPRRRWWIGSTARAVGPRCSCCRIWITHRRYSRSATTRALCSRPWWT